MFKLFHKPCGFDAGFGSRQKSGSVFRVVGSFRIKAQGHFSGEHFTQKRKRAKNRGILPALFGNGPKLFCTASVMLRIGLCIHMAVIDAHEDILIQQISGGGGTHFTGHRIIRCQVRVVQLQKIFQHSAGAGQKTGRQIPVAGGPGIVKFCEE